MVCLRIEAERTDGRAIASQLARFGCRVVEEVPGNLRVEVPYAETEREALAEVRLYLGPRNGWIRSARAA
jgi:hypothetical protein